MNYESITYLDISGRDLTELPEDLHLYINLVELNCSSNKISSLVNLPNTLIKLECCSNQLSSLNNLPVPVAAKTGTAQISEAGHFNTWIATFAPYDNPQIVLVITIESVEGLRAPTTVVARDVLDWYFSKK